MEHFTSWPGARAQIRAEYQRLENIYRNDSGGAATSIVVQEALGNFDDIHSGPSDAVPATRKRMHSTSPNKLSVTASLDDVLSGPSDAAPATKKRTRATSLNKDGALHCQTCRTEITGTEIAVNCYNCGNVTKHYFKGRAKNVDYCCVCIKLGR